MWLKFGSRFTSQGGEKRIEGEENGTQENFQHSFYSVILFISFRGRGLVCLFFSKKKKGERGRVLVLLLMIRI